MNCKLETNEVPWQGLRTMICHYPFISNKNCLFTKVSFGGRISRRVKQQFDYQGCPEGRIDEVLERALYLHVRVYGALRRRLWVWFGSYKASGLLRLAQDVNLGTQCLTGSAGNCQVSAKDPSRYRSANHGLRNPRYIPNPQSLLGTVIINVNHTIGPVINCLSTCTSTLLSSLFITKVHINCFINFTHSIQHFYFFQTF